MKTTTARTALEIETERVTHYRNEWQRVTRERDAAFSALKVILLTPKTRDALRDVDPMAFVQAAHAVPISSFPVEIDDATAAAVREVSRIVGIIENNPPSRRVF